MGPRAARSPPRGAGDRSRSRRPAVPRAGARGIPGGGIADRGGRVRAHQRPAAAVERALRRPLRRGESRGPRAAVVRVPRELVLRAKHRALSGPRSREHHCARQACRASGARRGADAGRWRHRDDGGVADVEPPPDEAARASAPTAGAVVGAAAGRAHLDERASVAAPSRQGERRGSRHVAVAPGASLRQRQEEASSAKRRLGAAAPGVGPPSPERPAARAAPAAAASRLGAASVGTGSLGRAGAPSAARALGGDGLGPAAAASSWLGSASSSRASPAASAGWARARGLTSLHSAGLIGP